MIFWCCRACRLYREAEGFRSESTGFSFRSPKTRGLVNSSSVMKQIRNPAAGRPFICPQAHRRNGQEPESRFLVTAEGARWRGGTRASPRLTGERCCGSLYGIGESQAAGRYVRGSSVLPTPTVPRPPGPPGTALEDALRPKFLLYAGRGSNPTRMPSGDLTVEKVGPPAHPLSCCTRSYEFIRKEGELLVSFLPQRHDHVFPIVSFRKTAPSDYQRPLSGPPLKTNLKKILKILDLYFLSPPPRIGWVPAGSSHPSLALQTSPPPPVSGPPLPSLCLLHALELGRLTQRTVVLPGRLATL